MAYYAVQEGSNYAVYKDGQRVSTTTSSGLSTWGLSPTNLGSATSSPSTTQSTYVAPTQTYTQPVSTYTAPTYTTPTPASTTSTTSYSFPTTNLQPGMTGSSVLQLQNWLMSQGYLTQAQINTGPGIYGPQTTAAVAAWQQAHRVNNSSGVGYWGPLSISAAQGGGTAASTTSTNPALASLTQQLQQASQTLNTMQQQPLMSNVNPGVTGATPVFMGQGALVKLNGYPGTYYINNTDKTIRPFQSDQAVYAMFPGVTPDHVVTLNAADLGPTGSFGSANGYQFLNDAKYAIDNSGNYLQMNASASQLQARYGQQVNLNAEQDAYMLVDGIIHSIRDNSAAGLPGSFLDTMVNNKSELAFMISAVAYGGYTPGDVYSELKRQYLISQGDTSVQGTSPISASMDRTAYQNTDAGKLAYSNPKLTPPTQIGQLDKSVINLPLFQIPQDAFNTLIPIMNPDTQEFKDAMAQIQDAYHEVLLMQLEANTQQEKQQADTAYQALQNSVSSTLGINLSNDALTAWSQIQNAQNQFAGQGISGSGLENESIDSYLKSVRNQAASQRTSSNAQTNQNEAKYYETYATPDQVKALIQSDPAKAQAYGLVPSADIKAQLTPAALKAKFPNLSDQEINDYISSILDENGNFRSTLYQTYTNNKLQTQQDEQTYKQQQVLNNSLLDEQKAYQEFTTPDVAFLRASPTSSTYTAMSSPTLGDLGSTGVSQYGNILSSMGATKPATGSTSSSVNTPSSTPTYQTPTYNNTSLFGQNTQNTGSAINTSMFNTPLKFGTIQQGVNTSTPSSTSAFNIPAVGPKSGVGSLTGNIGSTSGFKYTIPTASSPTSPNNTTANSTPSTVTNSTTSKVLSSLSSGLNSIKDFGSSIWGGISSLW